VTPERRRRQDDPLDPARDVHHRHGHRPLRAGSDPSGNDESLGSDEPAGGACVGVGKRGDVGHRPPQYRQDSADVDVLPPMPGRRAGAGLTGSQLGGHGGQVSPEFATRLGLQTGHRAATPHDRPPSSRSAPSSGRLGQRHPHGSGIRGDSLILGHRARPHRHRCDQRETDGDVRTARELNPGVRSLSSAVRHQ